MNTRDAIIRDKIQTAIAIEIAEVDKQLSHWRAEWDRSDKNDPHTQNFAGDMIADLNRKLDKLKQEQQRWGGS